MPCSQVYYKGTAQVISIPSLLLQQEAKKERRRGPGVASRSLFYAAA